MPTQKKFSGSSPSLMTCEGLVSQGSHLLSPSCPPPPLLPVCCRRCQTWCSGCLLPAWLHQGLMPGPPRHTQCLGCPRFQRGPRHAQGLGSTRFLPTTLLCCPTHSLTLRMKQNSELRRLESVLIWMHLGKEGVVSSVTSTMESCPLPKPGTHRVQRALPLVRI